MLSPLSCLEFTTLCPYILFQNYYSVQIVLTEHVSSTTESNEFELILINAFLNQCVVNSLSTFFRQLLVPGSATRSLVSITGNFVLLIRVSLQNLSSQLDVNHAVIIDASATNLEEDGTRTGNFNFLHYFLSYRLSVSQSVLSVSQVSLSLCQFASVLIDFVVDSILINFRVTSYELLATESIGCTYS